MPDAANIETGGNEAGPKTCPTCKRVPLILFTFSAGAIERARVGCLCRSVVVRSAAKRNDHPACRTGSERSEPSRFARRLL